MKKVLLLIAAVVAASAIAALIKSTKNTNGIFVEPFEGSETDYLGV